MVWTIITAVAGAVAAIAALITCILTYRTTRPHLAVKVNKIMLVSLPDKRFAFADIAITNKSAVRGTVAEITLCKGKMKCEGEYSHQHYDLSGITFEMTTNGILSEANRLTLPVVVDPFAVVNGFIIFPCLPDSIVAGDYVSICVENTDNIRVFRPLIKLITKLTKRRKYKIEQSTYAFE